MDWKLQKTDEKHAGRSTLLYELDLKAANVEQTYTQTHKMSTVTLVRMRRALTSEKQAGRYNLSRKREKKPGDW